MGRKPINKTCCVCMNTYANIKKLNKKDENQISLQTKLKTCVSEVEWLASYYLCNECNNLLDICYSFRESCLNSEQIRKERKTVKPENFEIEFKEEIKFEENKFDIEQEGIDLDETKELNDVSAENNLPDNTEGFESEDDLNDPSYNGEEEEVKENSDDGANKEYKSRKRKQNTSIKKIIKERTTRKRKKLNFVCHQCNKNFPTSTKLVKHCTEEHGMESKDVKPFSCERCAQRFATSSNLWQHIKYHDKVKSCVCSYCGQGFVTSTDLINHEKKHLNKREYRCEFCDKGFNTHKDLRSHNLIVHTDSKEWKYVCEICEKPFPIKSNYDSHIRRHTGEKKFACHLCEKRFTTKCDLQRHTRSHSHVREFRCNHCEKEYKDERVLKLHMAKIHGIGLGTVKIPVRERKYSCHHCPKAYYAKNKLTRHLYTHSGERPFSCSICDKKFNDKSYVKQHLKNTHNIDTTGTLESELKINYMNSSENTSSTNVLS